MKDDLWEKFNTFDKLYEKFDQLDNPYLRQLSKDLNPEDLHPQLREYLYDQQLARARDSMKKNKFGVSMYSEKCEWCLKHDDAVLICDLCLITFTSQRIHTQADRNPARMWRRYDEDLDSSEMIVQTTWIEEVLHNCRQTSKYLNLLLYAMLA